MKVLSHLVGLLVVGLVVVPSALADISLKLKQKQYTNNQQQFEESKYANSKYQVFEVHNHFQPSAGQSSDKKTTTNVVRHSDNVSAQTEEIRIEHINAPPGFPLDDPNLDATLLNVAAEDGDYGVPAQQQKLTTTQVNTNDNFPVPFPSNYRHEIPKSPKPRPVEYIEVRDDFKPSQPIQDFGSTSQYQGQQQQTVDSFPATEYLQPLNNHFGGSAHDEGRNNGGTPFKGSDYLPPQQTSGPQAKPFKGNQFLPPIPGSNGDENNPFKGPDYLPPPSSGSGQQSQETFNSNPPFKGPDYLPPRQQSGHVHFPQDNTFKGPDYLPPHQSGSGGQNSFEANSGYKGPDYLPPHQSGSGGQNSFEANSGYKGPDYLPPHQSGPGGQNSFEANSAYKGPDYLPPLQSGSGGQNSFETNSGYKGPDYLPPHAGDSSQETFRPNNAFKGPDYLPPQTHKHGAVKTPRYLPPGYDIDKPNNSEEAIAELHTLPEQSPNQQYHQEVTVQSQIQVGGGAQSSSDIVYGTSKHGSGTQAPSTSGYFSSGYDANSQSLSNSVQTQQGGSAGYQAAGYLPPGYDSQSATNSGPYQPPAGRDGKSYSASGYLPPGYDFQNPSVPEQGENYHASVQQSSGQVTSAQSFGQQQSYGQTFQGQQQTFEQQTFKGPDYLPPTSSPQVQQAGQAFKGPDYLPPTNNQHAQQAGPAFKGPDYLPPSNNPQAQQTGQTFKAPDYLPPTAEPGNDQQSFQAPEYLPPATGPQTFKGPDYLPPRSSQQTTYQTAGYVAPTVATQAPVQPQPTYMYPLSSYMTSVQPFERYGSARKPFLEYGPPPTPIATAFPNNEVAPMYKEPANRPQHYAPAMSYGQNSVSAQAYNAYAQQSTVTGSTLNEQARQALQTFMPKEIRQDYTPSTTATVSSSSVATSTGAFDSKVQVSGPASAKIRTVQIVNPTAVKTLKVLESLDHAGVKTIQILGPTNEEPMGEHRVVKVVSGHENNVQTVKIFNDQQDVTTSGGTSGSNDYLPPRRKRNEKKTIAKGRRRIVGN